MCVFRWSVDREYFDLMEYLVITFTFIHIHQQRPLTYQNRVLLPVVGCNVLVLHSTSQQACGIDSEGLLGFLCPLKKPFNYALLRRTNK